MLECHESQLKWMRDHDHIDFADFVKNNTASDNFPFTVWTRLMRETMSDEREKLMVSSPGQGIYELREAIAGYLFQFRGMKVSADRIIVGAGTEYLYSLIIQLLGRGKRYALEDPGYRKIHHIYKANEVDCVHVPLDSQGINVNMLEKSKYLKCLVLLHKWILLLRVC